MTNATPNSIDRRIYRLRSGTRRQRYFHVSREVIARCEVCGENFTWLPPNFDMQHRFNSTTHEYCGGAVVGVGEEAAGSICAAPQNDVTSSDEQSMTGEVK